MQDGFVPGLHPIDAYGNFGFRFAGMSHRGSILAMPIGIYALELQQGQLFLPEALEQLWQQASGSVELLLLGTGATVVPVQEALRWRLRSLNIRCEPMPTGAAARTYNILLSEKRRIAAALIAVP